MSGAALRRPGRRAGAAHAGRRPRLVPNPRARPRRPRPRRRRSIMAASRRCATRWSDLPDQPDPDGRAPVAPAARRGCGHRPRRRPAAGQLQCRAQPGHLHRIAASAATARDFSVGADVQHAALFGRPGAQFGARRRHAGRGRPGRSARDRGRSLHRGGRRLYGRDPRPLDRPAQPESGARAGDQFAGDARPLRGRRPDPHRRRPVRRPPRARPQPARPRRGTAQRPARRITGA